MSLNPSNLIAARANLGKTMFPNLARHNPSEKDKQEIDDVCIKELETAGIKVINREFLREMNGEVPTKIRGELSRRWVFQRAWYYWIAEGPGIPPDYAMKLHEAHGTEVRVDGHCGCPSPLEWFKGFAVGHYHVDTQEGLKALADTIKQIVLDAKVE
jgi:hypothetical protein